LTTIAGCVSYSVEKTFDKSDKVTQYSMKENHLVNKDGDEEIDINPVCVRKEGSDPRYCLDVEYRDREGARLWLYIKEGASLICTIDGREKIVFTGEGSKHYRYMEYGEIDERAYYVISPEVLQKMALAKSIEVKIVGEKRTLGCVFTGQNLNNFKRFMAEYVKTNK
jgi:hypothetical protein